MTTAEWPEVKEVIPSQDQESITKAETSKAWITHDPLLLSFLASYSENYTKSLEPIINLRHKINYAFCGLALFANILAVIFSFTEMIIWDLSYQWSMSISFGLIAVQALFLFVYREVFLIKERDL